MEAALWADSNSDFLPIGNLIGNASGCGWLYLEWYVYIEIIDYLPFVIQWTGDEPLVVLRSRGFIFFTVWDRLKIRQSNIL